MAINKAIEIDPNSNPDWYQIASKLYAQIGDNQNAQLNNNKAFDLANQLNENSSGQ
jgi:Tfp pilus assembly protein PilF